jgi:hypothetical protein
MKSKIGGKKREQGDFGKKAGLFTGEVVAVNPTTEEYVSILGYPEKEDAKDMVYTGESKDGNPYVRLDFWIRQTKTDKPFQQKVVFFVEDRIRINKDETKTQYINDIGICSWASEEGDLPDWFSDREYRVAKSGEEELYNFLRNFLGGIDFFDKTDPAELILDWKKLMKGNVSDLQQEIGGEWSVPFVSLATVITKEVEGDDGPEIKEYQGIYNKAFCPEFCMKHFRLLDYNDAMVQANVDGKKFKERKLHERFVANVIGEYGCKDFYTLSQLTDYDSSMNVVASTDTMSEEDSSPNY